MLKEGCKRCRKKEPKVEKEGCPRWRKKGIKGVERRKKEVGKEGNKVSKVGKNVYGRRIVAYMQTKL